MVLFEIDETLRQWIEARPPNIRAMCERWPPNRLYRLKETGQRVTLHSYAIDGTVKIQVAPEHNPGRSDVDRLVFGIDPQSLEECDAAH